MGFIDNIIGAVTGGGGNKLAEIASSFAKGLTGGGAGGILGALGDLGGDQEANATIQKCTMDTLANPTDMFGDQNWELTSMLDRYNSGTLPSAQAQQLQQWLEKRALEKQAGVKV